MARACSTLAAQFCTPRGGCRITDPISRIPLSTPPDTMCLSRPVRAKTRCYNIQERGSNIQDSPFHPSCYDVFIPTGECEKKTDPISRTEDPISKNHLFIPTDTISLSGPVSARERRSKIQDRRSNVQVALSDWDPPSPLVFKVGGRAPLDTHGATASVPGAPTPNFELRVRGLYPSNRPTLNYGCGCVSVSAQP